MRKSFPAAELAEVLGAAPVGWHTIAGGGYTRNTKRWRVELEDGRSTFVKLALDDLAAGWLRDERRVYSAVKAGFLAGFLGFGLRLTRLRDVPGTSPAPLRAGPGTTGWASRTRLRLAA